MINNFQMFVGSKWSHPRNISETVKTRLNHSIKGALRNLPLFSVSGAEGATESGHLRSCIIWTVTDSLT